jgi:hypothetical protein
MSFDLLSRLSKLNLVRGLPRLRFEKELVCAPCRHAKMVASSHPPLTDVMTERPCELLHMDLVGQLVCDLRVGSGMSLLWWTTTLGMCGCSFSRIRGKRLVLFKILSCGLRNERHEDAIRAIRSDSGSEFRNSRFEAFCHDLDNEHQFSSLCTPPKMVLGKGRTGPCVRWLGRCLMSIGLREGSGLRR